MVFFSLETVIVREQYKAIIRKYGADRKARDIAILEWASDLKCYIRFADITTVTAIRESVIRAGWMKSGPIFINRFNTEFGLNLYFGKPVETGYLQKFLNS
jgi:hypothetical protein